MKTFDRAVEHINANGFPLAGVYLPKINKNGIEVRYDTHKKGEILEVVSMRMAIMAGLRPKNVRLDSDWDCMQLYIDGNMWMSTHPIETFTHIYPAITAKGDVLVGGLGLGYVVSLLEKNPNVKSITVVELNEKLVKTLSPFISQFSNWNVNVSIVQSDIFDFLRDTKKEFDFIYLDTWTGTSEMEFFDTVVPLRRLAKPRLKKGGEIVCWMEEVMRGQVVRGIVNHIITKDIMPEFDLEKIMKHMKEWNPAGYDFLSQYKFGELVKLDKDKLYRKVERFVDKWSNK